MHPNDRYLMWLVLVIGAGFLVRQNACQPTGTAHGSVANARKLSAGLTAMNFNHLFGQAGGFADAGESVKFSASHPQPQQHALHPDAHGYGEAWRKPASNWRVRDRLAKPTPGSRSRINNRSMTRFSEVEIPAGMQYREELEVADPAPTPPRATNVSAIAEELRAGEKSRGVENLFWKYFVDGDVSASTEDDDDDDDDDHVVGAGQKTAIDRRDPEARKKKFHLKKKYKKFLIPLLLAYKIKFLALVPAIIGGLILLVKSAGLAGFFFALFTAVVSLKKY